MFNSFFVTGRRHQRDDADQLHDVQRRVRRESRQARHLQALALVHRRKDGASREAGSRLLLDW